MYLEFKKKQNSAPAGLGSPSCLVSPLKADIGIPYLQVNIIGTAVLAAGIGGRAFEFYNVMQLFSLGTYTCSILNKKLQGKQIPAEPSSIFLETV